MLARAISSAGKLALRGATEVSLSDATAQKKRSFLRLQQGPWLFSLTFLSVLESLFFLCSRNASFNSQRFPLALSQTRSYHDSIVEHYENPRNVGSLDKKSSAVGTGLVGAPACGDVMKLQIEVDEETGVILESKFKTFGCGSAIASSSVATEWVKGKTVDEVSFKGMALWHSLRIGAVERLARNNNKLDGQWTTNTNLQKNKMFRPS